MLKQFLKPYRSQLTFAVYSYSTESEIRRCCCVVLVRMLDQLIVWRCCCVVLVRMLDQWIVWRHCCVVLVKTLDQLIVWCCCCVVLVRMLDQWIAPSTLSLSSLNLRWQRTTFLHDVCEALTLRSWSWWGCCEIAMTTAGTARLVRSSLLKMWRMYITGPPTHSVVGGD